MVPVFQSKIKNLKSKMGCDHVNNLTFSPFQFDNLPSLSVKYLRASKEKHKKQWVAVLSKKWNVCGHSFLYIMILWFEYCIYDSCFSFADQEKKLCMSQLTQLKSGNLRFIPKKRKNPGKKNREQAIVKCGRLHGWVEV